MTERSRRRRADCDNSLSEGTAKAARRKTNKKEAIRNKKLINQNTNKIIIKFTELGT